jgi:sucrose-6-phosphate hydrolase SacC (GH32 family)
MMFFADSRRRPNFSKDPAVVRFHDRYLLYYSIPPYGDGRTDDGWGIGIAESHDLDHWQPIGALASDGLYEKKGFCAPGAIVLNGRVHLFYQTYGNGRHDAICHASSSDGLSFERNPGNPIFKASGTWNCGRAIDADVIINGDQLLLYWATRDPSFKQQFLGVAAAPLASSFGPDDWRQLCDQSILRPELPWEGDCIEGPALFRHQGVLHMFYAGAYNNWPQQIGCARSEDGLHWQRLSDQPVLPNGAPGTWNACESGHPFAFTDDDGSVHLFYQGNNDMGKTWYLSRLRMHWDDGKDLPVFQI